MAEAVWLRPSRVTRLPVASWTPSKSASPAMTEIKTRSSARPRSRADGVAVGRADGAALGV